jgi:transposase
MLHHIEGHLDSLQYLHILQNVMVPSVRMLNPDGIIHFQQDHSIHDSRVVQEWLLLQAEVELDDLSPRAPDMNPIENMWSEVKRTMQETWPVLLPRNGNELWTLVSDEWDKVVSYQRYVRSLIEFMTRRMKSGRSTGVLDFLLKRPVSENGPYKV